VAKSGNGSLRILVADDDVDTVTSFALLLRQIGHQVETATNAKAVLETVRQTLPQLIFLDIGLPDMDGWQLALLLKRELRDHAFALVAVTGHADSDSHIRSRKAGFDAHVAKPVDMALLDSILKQMQSKVSA
jgi:CheY-like chemotaxis protein